MEEMKRAFSRMLDDPQAPPLPDGADVFHAARRASRRSAAVRAATATLALAVMAGSWSLLRNDFAPRPQAAASASVSASTAPSPTPMQLTAADVADWLEPLPTPSKRGVWIKEGSTKDANFYWYIDVLGLATDPCRLPVDVPPSASESCAQLWTEAGEVWVRRLHSSPGSNEGIVVSIYIPVAKDRAFLYTASSVELSGDFGAWGSRRPGSPFQIADSEIAEIVRMAHELAQS